MLAVSLAVARLWNWPLLLAAAESLAFATGMTLVFLGEQIPIPYVPKAMLIVLSVVVSTWAFHQMGSQHSEASVADDGAAVGPPDLTER